MSDFDVNGVSSKPVLLASAGTAKAKRKGGPRGASVPAIRPDLTAGDVTGSARPTAVHKTDDPQNTVFNLQDLAEVYGNPKVAANEQALISWLKLKETGKVDLWEIMGSETRTRMVAGKKKVWHFEKEEYSVSVPAMWIAVDKAGNPENWLAFDRAEQLTIRRKSGETDVWEVVGKNGTVRYFIKKTGDDTYKVTTAYGQEAGKTERPIEKRVEDGLFGTIGEKKVSKAYWKAKICLVLYGEIDNQLAATNLLRFLLEAIPGGKAGKAFESLRAQLVAIQEKIKNGVALEKSEKAVLLTAIGQLYIINKTVDDKILGELAMDKALVATTDEDRLKYFAEAKAHFQAVIQTEGQQAAKNPVMKQIMVRFESTKVTPQIQKEYDGYLAGAYRQLAQIMMLQTDQVKNQTAELDILVNALANLKKSHSYAKGIELLAVKALWAENLLRQAGILKDRNVPNDGLLTEAGVLITEIQNWQKEYAVSVPIRDKNPLWLRQIWVAERKLTAQSLMLEKKYAAAEKLLKEVVAEKGLDEKELADLKRIYAETMIMQGYDLEKANADSSGKYIEARKLLVAAAQTGSAWVKAAAALWLAKIDLQEAGQVWKDNGKIKGLAAAKVKLEAAVINLLNALKGLKGGQLNEVFRLYGEALVRQAYVAKDQGMAGWDGLLAAARVQLTRAGQDSDNGRVKAESNLWLAKIAMITKNYDEALRLVSLALTGELRDGDMSDAHKVKGEALLGQKHYAAAIVEFEAALKLNDRNLEAKIGIADAYNFSRRYKDADDMYVAAGKMIMGTHYSPVDPTLILRVDLGQKEVVMRKTKKVDLAAAKYTAKIILSQEPIGSYLAARAVGYLAEAYASTIDLSCSEAAEFVAPLLEQIEKPVAGNNPPVLGVSIALANLEPETITNIKLLRVQAEVQSKEFSQAEVHAKALWEELKAPTARLNDRTKLALLLKQIYTAKWAGKNYLTAMERLQSVEQQYKNAGVVDEGGVVAETPGVASPDGVVSVDSAESSEALSQLYLQMGEINRYGLEHFETSEENYQKAVKLGDASVRAEAFAGLSELRLQRGAPRAAALQVDRANREYQQLENPPEYLAKKIQGALAGKINGPKVGVEIDNATGFGTGSSVHNETRLTENFSTPFTNAATFGITNSTVMTPGMTINTSSVWARLHPLTLLKDPKARDKWSDFIDVYVKTRAMEYQVGEQKPGGRIGFYLEPDLVLAASMRPLSPMGINWWSVAAELRWFDLYHGNSADPMSGNNGVTVSTTIDLGKAIPGAGPYAPWIRFNFDRLGYFLPDYGMRQRQALTLDIGKDFYLADGAVRLGGKVGIPLWQRVELPSGSRPVYPYYFPNQAAPYGAWSAGLSLSIDVGKLAGVPIRVDIEENFQHFRDQNGTQPVYNLNETKVMVWYDLTQQFQKFLDWADRWSN